MTFRRFPLVAFAALVTASAALPALADDMSGGIPLGGTTNNSLSASNVAAGEFNSANQKIHSSQTGQSSHPSLGYGMNYSSYNTPSYSPSYVPSTTSNSTTASNVAAGIDNSAFQKLNVHQGGFTPGIVTNSVDAQNLAAGLGNLAKQRINTTQK
ncbi:MAG TPA: hypothetical protein VK558_18920 [Patescibacteria group bacterium]|nr:hypothetical protein [Patescibacteria group bacterium]